MAMSRRDRVREALSTTELAAMEIFAGCSQVELSRLVTGLQPLQAGTGTELMRQGEPAVSFCSSRRDRPRSSMSETTAR